jgi:hypothetical protein
VIAGHVGLAAAAYHPRRDGSPVWLLGASMAPDMLDGLYVIAGLCNPHGLYSHTVPAAALLAAAVGGTAFLATDRRAFGLMAAALVLLHLPLDYVTGLKLFWPGDELRGLRLYSRPGWDFVLESTIALTGWWLLRRRTGAARWTTAWPAITALLALQATADIVGGSRGGVKPSACGQEMVVGHE